ncbi:MAG TPA: hypothetical protein VHW23_41905 [Kofleriaceae bacterium]|jgi:hypothetical protein|nr:hypothetical protein [Kofleriaceae bacterium]
MDRPGYAEMFLTPERSWIQGEPSRVTPTWAYACDGTGDWGCPSSTLTVLQVTCDGCMVTDSPVGVSDRGGVEFHATATTDGPVTIGAQIRFDPTGEIATVTASTVGDHETGIEGRCRLIDTATLAQRNLGSAVPGELFRDCSTPRHASDSVVLFPALRTFHGNARFPVCVTSTLCGGFDGDRLRPASAVSIDPAPTGWGQSDEIEPAEFAILPAMPAGGTVTLNAQLSPTGTATAEVEIPAIQ